VWILNREQFLCILHRPNAQVLGSAAGTGMLMPGLPPIFALPPSSFFCFPQRSLNASDREKGGRFGIPLEQFNASSEQRLATSQ